MNNELQTPTSSFYFGEFLVYAFGQIKKKVAITIKKNSYIIII